MLYRRSACITFLFSLQCLLSACGSVTIRDTATQSNIPIQGWMLELHRDVVIPPHRTRVFFQAGRLIYGINEFEPHCQLRVRDISEQAQDVHADLFTIGKVFGTLDQIVSNEPVRLAAAGGAFIVGGGNGNGNGESRQMYLYFMALHAEKQTNVTYLVCGGALDDPALAEYPTIQEIRTAMGDYATLVLPDQGN